MWGCIYFVVFVQRKKKKSEIKRRNKFLKEKKYIEKKNELCLEGFSVDNGKKSIITIASTYNYLLDDSYSPYMTCRSLNNPDLEKKLAAMIQEVGFEGIFEVEFLVDQNDELYFLEINFRNSTWSYASTVAGMPMPVLWAKGMINPIDIDGKFVKIKEPFTAMVEFDDYRQRVKTGKITKKEWFREFKESKCKYYVAHGDYAPVISVIMKKFKRIVSSKK